MAGTSGGEEVSRERYDLELFSLQLRSVTRVALCQPKKIPRHPIHERGLQWGQSPA